jgi:hypothetical protein
VELNICNLPLHTRSRQKTFLMRRDYTKTGGLRESSRSYSLPPIRVWGIFGMQY